MSKIARYSVSSLLAAALGVVIAVILQRTREEHSALSCERLEVNFTDSLHFVTESDVRGYLDEDFGIIVGERLDSLRLARIEEVLESKSAVSTAEAWTGADGVLHLDITQRAPVLRFQEGERGFYIDAQANVFPLHKYYVAPVPLVRGKIPLALTGSFKGEAPPEYRELLDGMLAIDSFIRKSRRWRGRITGIEIAPDGDIVFRTSLGDEAIVFGDTHSVKEKFSRMEKYFNLIRPSVEDGRYNKVTVKYKSQVICKKDI